MFVQKYHLWDDGDLKKRGNKETPPSVRGSISQTVIELDGGVYQQAQAVKSSKPHLVNVGLLISHIFHLTKTIISCTTKQHTHDTCDDYFFMRSVKEAK